MEQWMSPSTDRDDEHDVAPGRSSRSSRRNVSSTWRGRVTGGLIVLLAALVAWPGSAAAQQAPYPAPQPPSSYPPPPPPPATDASQQPPPNYYQPPPANNYPPPPNNYQQPPPNYYQQPPPNYYQPPPGTYYPPSRTDERQLRVGRRLRGAGIGVTTVGIVGSALLLAGIGVLFDPFGDPYAATALIGVGVAFAIPGLAVGIPLWAVGQRKINRARRPGFAIAPWLAPTRSPVLGSTGATGALGGVTLRF